MLIRRSMLLGATCLGAGCQSFTDQDVASAAQKASILANGARGVLAALASLNIPGLTPSIMGTVGVAISGIQAVADALGQASTKTAALPLVQKLGTYVNDVISALAVVTPLLPPPIAIALSAIQVMLPLIQAAIGMLVPKAAPGTMNEAQATAVLVSFGAQVK